MAIEMAVVYNATFRKFFWRVFSVEIRQVFIGIASLIASFCTMKASQGFSRVLNPNMQLKNHFNCNKSRFNLNFFRRIPSPESPKSRIIDNSIKKCEFAKKIKVVNQRGAKSQSWYHVTL